MMTHWPSSCLHDFRSFERGEGERVTGTLGDVSPAVGVCASGGLAMAGPADHAALLSCHAHHRGVLLANDVVADCGGHGGGPHHCRDAPLHHLWGLADAGSTQAFRCRLRDSRWLSHDFPRSPYSGRDCGLGLRQLHRRGLGLWDAGGRGRSPLGHPGLSAPGGCDGHGHHSKHTGLFWRGGHAYSCRCEQRASGPTVRSYLSRGASVCPRSISVRGL